MSTKSKNQMILINENEDQAKVFIIELEATYLPAVSIILESIKDLGIENPSKSMLIDTIQGSFGQLEAAYNEVTKADIEGFKSKAAKEQMTEIFTGKLNEIKEQVAELFSSSVGNQYLGGGSFTSYKEMTKHQLKWGIIPMSDADLANMFDLADGVPVISEETKESIKEAFRDYTTLEEVKIYEAQKKAAEALNEFVSVLNKSGHMKEFDPNFPPFLFAWFSRYFISKETEAGFEISANTQGVKIW